MATRPIDFIISAVNQASPAVQAVVRDFRSLQSEARAVSTAIGKAIEPNTIQRAASSISSIGAAFFGIQQAIGVATATGGKFYDLLIGQNERLTQQLLQSAATIAATSRVFQDGAQIADPTQAIKALQDPLLAAIKEVEVATLDLVGITSQQTSGVFNVLLSNASQLANQSTQFKDSIDAATALAPSLVATLGSLGLPLQQASQEIRSILTGDINSDSIIARQLGLSNQLVAQYRAQGVLVDELVKRFQPFVEANRLAARSVAGLSSNIQDIVELTAREAGAPLVEELVDGLEQVYTFLRENREAIQEFADAAVDRFVAFSDVVGELSPRLIEAFAPILESGGKTTIEFLGLLADGFITLTQVGGEAAIALAPIAEGFAEINGQAIDLIRDLQSLLGLLSGSYASSLEGAEASGRATAQIAEESLRRQQELKEAIDAVTAAKENGGQATEGQINAARAELAATDQTIEGLKSRKREIQSLLAITVGDENRRALEQQIAEVGQFIDTLETATARAKELGITGSITFKPPEIADRGDLFKQLQSEADAARNSLESAVNSQELDSGYKKLTALVQQQFQLGAITAEQAAQQLEAIRSDGRAGYETQLAAQKAITEVYQSEGDRRIEALKSEQAEIQALVEQGAIGAAEGARRASVNQLAQLQAQLDQTQAAIARARDNGQGDSAEARKLAANEQRIQSEIASAKAKERERINAEELKDFDEQQQVLEGRRAQGLVTEQQFAQQSLNISLAKADKELQQVQAARGRLNAADTEGLEALAAREAEIYERRQQALVQFQQQQLAIVQARQKEAQDTIAISAAERETDLQNLVNAGVIRQSEAEQEKVRLQRESLDAQLKAAQENAAALEALPAFSDPQLERDRQAQIRQARLETANLTKSLAQNEFEAQQAAFNAFKSQLDRQVQDLRNNATAQTQPLELQAQLNEAINRSLEQRSQLLNAQKGLAEAIANAAQGQFQILAQSARNEGERRRLAQAEAAYKLRGLQVQQQYELESLRIQQQQNDLALERQQIELQIQRIKAQADAAAARAELQKTKADPNATPEAIRAAQLDVAAKDQAVGLLGVQQGLLADQRQTSNQLQASQEQALRVNQANALQQAQLAFAQSLPAGQRRRAVRELEQGITGGDRSRFFGDLRGFVNDTIRSTFASVPAGRLAARSPIALPSSPRLPQGQVQRPQIDQSLPVAGTQPAVGQPVVQALGLLKVIADRLSRPEGLITIAQDNQIVNQFAGSDAGNGNFASTIEQQVLNSLFSVGQQLLT